MKDEIHFDDFIDRYLEDEMPENERTWFTGEMQGNAALAERVDLTKSLAYELSHGLFDLRDNLEQMHTDLFGNSKNRIQKSWFAQTFVRYAAAAIIILGLVSGSLLVVNNYFLSSDEIYIRYYEPFEGNFQVRSVVAMQDSMLLLGMRSYESKDFEQALICFESVLKESPDKAVVNFYSGMSSFEIQKYEDAGESFNKVMGHNDNLYIEQAQWYLGFCYVMTDQPVKAKEHFEEIASGEGYYQKKARKIARRIRE